MTGCDDGWRSAGTVLVVAVLAGLAGGRLAAQPSVDSVPTQAVYGAGVHSFFAGQLGRSYDDLTNAIEAGSRDPRVYYFRGLAALRMGRTDEAEADFTKGAELEADPERLMAVDVARSLERVQGPDRLQLERHRTRARLVSQQQNRRASQRRYLDTMDAQDEVQRQRPRRDEEIREQIDQFQENQGAGSEPPAELPPLQDPRENPQASPMNEPAERLPAEPAADEPSERVPADAATEEPMAEPARQPADEPAEEMNNDKQADTAAGDAQADGGSGDAAADLPAEREAEPPMEEQNGLGEGEPFTP